MEQRLGTKSEAQARRFGIPVDSFNPGTYWIVCLDRESARPTVEEFALLRSYRDYLIARTYNERYARKLMAMPLPACGGHNTTILRKQGPGEWQFRRMSWQIGPLYIPPRLEEGYQKASLREILDRAERIGDTLTEGWLRWKASHPDLFSRAA